MQENTLPFFARPAAEIISKAKAAICELSDLHEEERIFAINELKRALHSVSPFRGEPVDCVLWERAENVVANDYNPNSVAPPEMELLRVSIMEDGYTQPIVTFLDSGHREVVDGFHRNRVGKECADVRKRILGYLPVVTINESRREKGDRIAATIRHNRARGKHKVEAMSDIVLELKRRNWTDERICRELGMDKDEVLRLCQITGLAEAFSDKSFSRAWDVEGNISEEDFHGISDEDSGFGSETEDFRAVNTGDAERIFHTHDKWECFAAGFYKTSVSGLSRAECESKYAGFLADAESFAAGLDGVIREWKHSCEHYLTNKAMNRIAWLGQAAACYSVGLPSEFRAGYYLLTKEQKENADGLALKYLNEWLSSRGMNSVTMDEAISGDRQSNIY